MDELIKEIKKFLGLQMGLWEQLKKDIPELDSFLLNVPDSGNLNFKDSDWYFSKHGLGICFVEKNQNIKVNFHKVENGSDSFDAWSLSSYFGSLGNRGAKILRKAGAVSGSLENRLKEILVTLEVNDVVQRNGDCYQIIEK